MPTIVEQLTSMSVTHTLKQSSLPAAFTLLPWSGSTGTWSESVGWSPNSHLYLYLEEQKAGSRSGVYWNTEKLKGGNAATALRWDSINGTLIKDRQFSVWLFSAAGASPSGYQLRVWQSLASQSSNVFDFELRKCVPGSETLLEATLNVPMEPTGSFAVVALGGKVSAWVKKNSASAWSLVGNEIADSTLTEGYSAIDGNGSNPRLTNFSTATLLPLSSGPRPGSRALLNVGR